MKRTLKLLYIISLFLCYLSSAYAGELKITKLTANNNNYEIILNNAVCIKNIILKNKNDTKVVEFPKYISKGKIYRQFSVLKRDYGDYLANSISEKKIYNFYGSTSFHVNKFSKTKKEGSIKAFASVIFEDLLEVECRVMEGKNGLWIAWPASKTPAGWNSEFVFTDKKLKKQVEDSLMQKYKDNENERK